MQSTPRRTLRLPAAVVAIVLLAGCGGALPEAGGKAAPGSDFSPGGVPEAQADLDHAEAQLNSAIGAPAYGAAPAQPSATSAPVEQRADSPPPPPAAPPESAPHPTAEAAPRDPCATACSALASMERAADHLCVITGEGDDRCSSARGRVTRANDRVRAQCPACG